MRLPPVDDGDSDSEIEVIQVVPTRLHERGAGERSPALSSEDRATMLTKSMKAALEDYLKDRRLVKVQIRHVDGSKVEGFLKIEGGKAERLLVDFKAGWTPHSGLSSLEVGGKKISRVVGATTKQSR